MNSTSIIYKYLNVSPLIAIWGTDYETIEKWVDANKIWGHSVFMSPAGIVEKGKRGAHQEIGEYVREVILRVPPSDVSTWIVRNCHFGLRADECLGSDYMLMDLLIETYRLFKVTRKSMVFVGPPLTLHPAIRPLVREFHWPRLCDNDRNSLLAAALQSAHNRGKLKNIESAVLPRAAGALQGFGAREVNEVMALSYLSTQGESLVDAQIVDEMRAMKRAESYLAQEALGPDNTEPIVGFENIERAMQIALRNMSGQTGRLYGQLPLNASFLVYGYSGTGKTAFARWFCCRHNIAHYSLQISQIRHENYGESEKRLQAAFAEIRTVCLESRAVLLAINEFEKLFSMNAADNSAQRALIVQLLDFLGGEKPANLIVYATANRIDGIRATGEEVLRRFTVFFSGLPGYEARVKIIKGLVERFTRGRHEVTDEDIDRLAQGLGRVDAATLREAILKAVCECGDEGRLFDGAALKSVAGLEGVYKKHDPFAREVPNAGSVRSV